MREAAEGIGVGLMIFVLIVMWAVWVQPALKRRRAERAKLRSKAALIEGVDPAVITRLRTIAKLKKMQDTLHELSQPGPENGYNGDPAFQPVLAALSALIAQQEGRKLPPAPVSDPLTELLEEHDG